MIFFLGLKKLQPALPLFIGKHVNNLKQLIIHLLHYLLVSLHSFLPCGFTQSMQIYALSTGSFATASIIMFAFALGTLPVLALLSFSSSAIHKKPNQEYF